MTEDSFNKLVEEVMENASDQEKEYLEQERKRVEQQMEAEWKNIWVIQTKNSDGDWVSITQGDQMIRFGNKESAQGVMNSFIENYGMNPNDIRIQAIITSE